MEEFDSTMYRSLLEGQSSSTKTLPSKYPRFHRRLLDQQEDLFAAPIIEAAAETRDDAERPKAQRKQARIDQAVVDYSSSEGMICVEVPLESIPGITFARHSMEAPLQIDYVHPDSMFAATPLVPGLMVARINNQEMTYKSPGEAQDELVNDAYPSTSVEVYGYVGKVHRATRRTKIGLILKDSTAMEGVFISCIKDDSIFHKTGLRVGLQVLAINRRQCPTEIIKAIKRLQKTTGGLEIVAINPYHFASGLEPQQKEDRQLDVVGTDQGLQKEAQDESRMELSALLEALELSSPIEMPQREPEAPCIHEIIDLCDHEDEESIEVQLPSAGRRDPEGMQLESGAVHKESESSVTMSASATTNTTVITPSEGSSICQALVDEAAEFVDDHKKMIENSVRSLLGEKWATPLVGEKKSEKWRAIDVCAYSNIQSLPTVVNSVIGQPTPPMLLNLPTKTTACSSFCTAKLLNQYPMVRVSLPAEPSVHSYDQEEIFYDAACTGPLNQGELVESQPGIVIAGMELAFRHKAVFLAKKKEKYDEKKESKATMALFLIADNALVSLDNLCGL